MEADFDGTMVLERLAGIGKLEEYAEAVDADDLEAVGRLLRIAGFDSQTIALVLEAILEG